MPDATIIPVARETTGSAAIVDPLIYARLYDSSIRDPERFWDRCRSGRASHPG
jgi:hypothetical protein